MKTRFGLLMTLMVLFASALLPSPARAQQAPIDCSNGCYIITCNTQLCTLWRCTAKGCEYISGWDRQVAEGPQSANRAAQAKAAPEVAYASVCTPGKPCDLYELTATQAQRIDSFDNAADLVRQREQLRGAGHRLQ